MEVGNRVVRVVLLLILPKVIHEGVDVHPAQFVKLLVSVKVSR
jgi:hypothetical protein